MKIALVLTHNKTKSENTDQITALKGLLTAVLIPAVDSDGNPYLDETSGEQKQLFVYYQLKDLPVEHQIYLYQIVPAGTEVPANFNDFNSHNVVYGQLNDSDKVEDHPRFFNWGLKRATDYAADVVLQIEDIVKIDLADLDKQIAVLIDSGNSTEFVETGYGRLSTPKLLKEVGQLKEELSFTEAITDYKQRIADKEITNG